LSATEAMEREEHTAPAAMVLAARPDPGVYALAAMPEADFEQRLELFVTARKRVQKVQKALMTEDVHFGTIPGTKKPTLMKSGAEVLCNAFGLVPTYETTIDYGDGVSAPHITVTAKALVHLGESLGPVVAEGMGACNSWEKHYRYRTAQLQCPACGQETLFKSKKDPEFFCWSKKGGCGATFPLTDERISKQERGQVENPDPFELLNTILKMAKKRAKVDATLEATATSDLFTQDLEESLSADPSPPTPPPQRSAPPRSNGKATPRQKAFRDAVDAARMQMTKPLIQAASELGRAMFHAAPEDLTDDQYDVILVWLRNGCEFPAEYPDNDVVMPPDVRGGVLDWMAKHQADAGQGEAAAWQGDLE